MKGKICRYGYDACFIYGFYTRRHDKLSISRQRKMCIRDLNKAIIVKIICFFLSLNKKIVINEITATVLVVIKIGMLKRASNLNGDKIVPTKILPV